jgi:hypothetical protein
LSHAETMKSKRKASANPSAAFFGGATEHLAHWPNHTGNVCRF